MKLILRNSFLFFLILTSSILLITQGDKLYAFVEEVFTEDEGILLIVNVDAKNGDPIQDATFQLLDGKTNQVIEEIVTANDGVATSKLLPINKQYKIVQTAVEMPYQVNSASQIVMLNSPKKTIFFENDVNSSVTAFERNKDSEIIPTEMNLPVKELLQRPELPNGCEVTSLTAVLDYYGYEVDKTVLADEYLPKIPFEIISGKLYGANPNEAYAGDPRSKNQGFYSYVSPVIKTANAYLAVIDGAHQPRDISGSSEDEVLSYIKQGIPVIIWTTINQQDPLFNYSWYVSGTDERINVLRNSHTVVLTGFSEDKVFVMDPLKGNVSYPKKRFFAIYEKAGSHGMIIQ